MKTLYLQCQMGAAGDMLLAALTELLPDPASFLQALNGLGLPGVCFSAEHVTRCGISGTHMTVTVHGQEEDHLQDHSHHHHAHTTLEEIHRCIDRLSVSDTVRGNAKAVYDRIARAESQVHAQPVEAVHFHEVGAWDAVADVVGVCLAIEWLSPGQILASPVHVGSGFVHCAHGLLPVPAPATSLLLANVPIYGGSVEGELCTPTGAALLSQFVSAFGDMPVLQAEKIGYGMGSREFDRANCVRAFWGESRTQSDTVLELTCNLDDMTGEDVGFAQELLLEAGALDVFTTAIGMKKSRPGIMLTCLSRPEDVSRLTAILLRHTTTLGVRQTVCHRQILPRSTAVVQTAYGPIRVKQAGTKGKAEYEDLAQAARKNGKTLFEIRQALPDTLPTA